MLLDKVEALEDLDGGGVYVGACGVALTLWHVAQASLAAGPSSTTTSSSSPLASTLQAAGWDAPALLSHAARICHACVHDEDLRPHAKVCLMVKCFGGVPTGRPILTLAWGSQPYPGRRRHIVQPGDARSGLG